MSYNLSGFKLEFVKDKKPFPAQMSVMAKSLHALKNSHSALLESPTGTGKTLALLTSTLCWQKQHYEEQVEEYHLLMQEYTQITNENERIQMEYFKVKVDKAKEIKAKEAIKEKENTETKTETEIPNAKKRKGKDKSNATATTDLDQGTKRITRASQSTISHADENNEGEQDKENDADGKGSKKIKMATTSHEIRDSEQQQQQQQQRNGNSNGSWIKNDFNAGFTAMTGTGSGSGASTGMTPTQMSNSSTSSSSPMECEEEVDDDIQDIQDCDAHDEYNESPMTMGQQQHASTTNSTTTTTDTGPKLLAVPSQPEAPKRATIYFCSRTHSQLKQVVDELKQVDDEYLNECNSCILGSRQQLCVNSSVKNEAEVHNIALNECCNKAILNRQCRYTNNNVVDNLVSKLNKLKVWDIEEATNQGAANRGCPYMAVRTILSDTSPNLVLCPYNYILDKNIRETMKLELEGAVIVFDEAHNLEDTCRSAASASLHQSVLERSWKRLNILQGNNIPIVKDMRNLVENIKNWMERMDRLLDAAAIKRQDNVWKGREILDICQEQFALDANTVEVFSAYLKEFRQEEDVFGKLTYESEEEEKQSALDGATHQLLNGFFQAFSYMSDPANLDSYRMILSSQWKPNQFGRNVKENVLIFSCLNAGVAYKDATQGVRSVLLTSGTLSPLQSFAGEFGVSFPVSVEAKHSIDLNRQIFVRVIESSNNVLLKGVFQNQKTTQWQDAIGNAVLNASAVTPGGLLVFVSSYGLLATLKERFSSPTGYEGDSCIDRIQANNTLVFVEPKGSKELEVLLKEYYKIIDDGGKAVLFAVCRGKVSEGIDFANNYARTVMLVGIPFPSFADIEVTLKRQYQDQQNRINPNQVNGNTWYEVQAFRALNQAMGRCLRHRNDYGAILLCDVRFNDQKNKNNMSRWMRGLITNGGAIDDVVLPLKLFFQQVAQEFPYTNPITTVPPSKTMHRIIGLNNTNNDKIKSEVKNELEVSNDDVNSDSGPVNQGGIKLKSNQGGKKKGGKSKVSNSSSSSSGGSSSSSSRSGKAKNATGKKTGTTQLTLI